MIKDHLRPHIAWGPVLIAILASVFAGLGVQIISLAIWWSRLEVRIEAIEKSCAANERDLARLDERGSRQLPLYDQRLKLLESQSQNYTAIINELQRYNTTMPIQLESLKSNYNRLEDQQRRIIEALDNLYSQVTKIPPVLRANPPDGR